MLLISALRSLLLRSFSRLNLAIPLLGFGHIGFPLLLRSSARLGLAILVVDVATAGFPFPLRQLIQISSPLLVLSQLRVGPPLLVFCDAQIELSLSLHSLS